MGQQLSGGKNSRSYVPNAGNLKRPLVGLLSWDQAILPSLNSL